MGEIGIILQQLVNFENQLAGIDFQEFQEILLKSVEILQVPEIISNENEQLYFLTQKYKNNLNLNKQDQVIASSGMFSAINNNKEEEIKVDLRDRFNNNKNSGQKQKMQQYLIHDSNQHENIRKQMQHDKEVRESLLEDYIKSKKIHNNLPQITHNFLRESTSQQNVINNKEKESSIFGFKQQSYQRFNLNRKQCEFIREATGGSKFKSLYNGVYCKFSSFIFHNKCDNKGKVLILVKTEYKQVFGIVVSQMQLEQKNGRIQLSDDEALVLQVTQKTKHEQVKPIKKSLVLSSTIFIGFACGDQSVVIRNKCNEDETNKCVLNPNLFQLPELYSNTFNNKTYMGGAENFKVEEIECFQILKASIMT
eukprot:403360087